MPPEAVGILVYLAGLTLLFLELFIPSGGILGIVGTICTIYGIWQILAWNAWVGGIIILITVAYVYMILRFWGKRVRMTGSLAGSVSTNPESSPTDLVGKEGITTTVLRPAGFATVDGKRVQVVAEGSFIPKGRKIKVVEVEGNRIVVTSVEIAEADEGDEAL